MSNFIKEMSWYEFDKRRQSTKTVIIPSGAVEVYGPHMPMGSDIIAAEAIAERAAEKTGAMIAPKLEMGDSAHLAGFPGTMVMRKETFKAVMEDTVKCLIDYGMENILFISGHAGNLDMLQAICKRLTTGTDIKCAIVDWWRFTAANSEGLLEHSGQMAHGHASECGTSVMLYLRPELVNMELAAKVEPVKPSEYPDFITFDRFKDRTDNGIIGDATAATREKGEKIVNICVDRIVDFMEKTFG